MNLIENEWIPVRRRSGKVARIAPWQLTDGFAEDPIIMVSAPRPDFNGALVQYLIGLLQTGFAPDDARAWRRRLREPPAPAELKEAFLTVASAFYLDEGEARFLQDLNLELEIRKLMPSEQQKRTCGVGDLLIEMPTGKTLEDNTDHFVKRGRVAAMCPACVAAGLLSLQTNAPAGGQGHRTGLRGGGPLTTLILADSLWATTWLNVLERGFFNATGNPARNAPGDRFPWLGQTRTSEDDRATTPDDAHPAQVFWGMPRRIRLTFSNGQANCDVCGAVGNWLVSQYLTKNFGVHYVGPWRHPLSPYFVGPEGARSAVHPRGGIGYRHWLGLVHGTEDPRGKREPAAVVERYLRIGSDDLRLWAFGYDMDNMKARCWYDASMPLPFCPEDIREAFAFRVKAIVQSAGLAASATRAQLKKALFKPGVDVPGNLLFIAGRYWQETESPFYTLLPRVRQVLREHGDAIAILEEWHKTLVKTAEGIFDDVSRTGAFDAADPKRIALAWRDLQKEMHGRKMRQTLGLPDGPSKTVRVGQRKER